MAQYLLRPKSLMLPLAMTLLSSCAFAQPGGAAPTATAPSPAVSQAAEVSRNPVDIPPPITRTVSANVVVHLTTRELVGKLADGVTYSYWTFDGTVPGPLLRVRHGDTVELHLKNDPSGHLVHSIDLHAVTGPGGGAGATQVKAGEEKMFSFKALNPGVYVYHCATPHLPSHIANGMYGLMVVEPEGGLSPVDREFYVMQGEIYTRQALGSKGHLDYDVQRLLDERPTFVVFNGKVAALTGDHAMKAKVGERIRIFTGNGGPNLLSSFHVIGTILDKVHPEGASEAVSNVQTTLIPAGGATWVEFTARVPGTLTLVDHSISRALDRGALAQIIVEGPANSDVFNVPPGQATSAH